MPKEMQSCSYILVKEQALPYNDHLHSSNYKHFLSQLIIFPGGEGGQIITIYTMLGKNFHIQKSNGLTQVPVKSIGFSTPLGDSLS